MSSKQSSEQRKSTIINLFVYVIPTAGLAFILMLGEWWPAEPLMRFQSSILDGYYYPTITFLLTWLVILFPVLFIKMMVMRTINKAKYRASAEAGADGSTTLTVQRERQLFNMAMPASVYIDGQKIGAVSSGKSKVFSVYPGNRNIEIRLDAFKSPGMLLQLQPGTNTQVETGFTGSALGAIGQENSLYLRSKMITNY